MALARSIARGDELRPGAIAPVFAGANSSGGAKIGPLIGAAGPRQAPRRHGLAAGRGPSPATESPGDRSARRELTISLRSQTGTQQETLTMGASQDRRFGRFPHPKA